MKPKIIERDGEQFVLIPFKDFERLVRKSELFPHEVTGKIKAGYGRVRAFREYRGMTQKELASAVGVARPYITEIESGRKTGSVQTLERIAAALGLDLQDIT